MADDNTPANLNPPGLFDAILASVSAGISTYRDTTAANNEAAKASLGRTTGSGSGSGLLILGAVIVALYFAFEG